MLTGVTTDRDRDQLFKVTGCAVLPSLSEPFGIVALEAMAKCPVVVSAVCGLRDAVQHGEPGLRVQPDNPESLGAAIVHTLRHGELATLRVEKAYRVAREEFNWERIARLTSDAYRRVIAEKAIVDW